MGSSGITPEGPEDSGQVSPLVLGQRYLAEQLVEGRAPEEIIGALCQQVEALLRRIADTDHGLDGRRVTLSAGVAAPEPGLDTLDALLQKADRALYRAKSGGRDRSEMATLPMPLDEPPPA